MTYSSGDNETARLWQLANNEYRRVLSTEQAILQGSEHEPIERNTAYFKRFGSHEDAIYLERSERWKGNQLLDEVQYDHYNTYGNPQQVHRQREGPTVYLWGYQGQYPVARIQNATFSQVEAALGGSSAAAVTLNALLSATVTDALIQSTLETIRTQLNHSRVSSAHYKPLIGISRMTDPRGLSEYYQYDGLGRLKRVLNFEDYLLRQYDYHFKP